MSDDIQKMHFHAIPTFTKYYLCGVFAITVTLSYPIFQIAQHIVLDYDQAIFSFQIWRFIITNLILLVGINFPCIFYSLLDYDVSAAYTCRD